MVWYQDQGRQAENGQKFLACGQLVRPLEFRKSSRMPMLSMATMHGRGAGRFPSLMSDVSRSPDGGIGVFAVNTSAKSLEF